MHEVFVLLFGKVNIELPQFLLCVLNDLDVDEPEPSQPSIALVGCKLLGNNEIGLFRSVGNAVSFS